MSPTAQPEERHSATSKAVWPHPSDSSGQRANPKVTSTELSSADESREKEVRRVIMLISICYPHWVTKTSSKSENPKLTELESRGLKPLELKAVRNDLDTQLRRHNYRHDGTPETFLIYTDYEDEYEYTDSNGISAVLPRKQATKANILDGFVKAVSSGGFVVIYYSGHAGCSGSGESTLTPIDVALTQEEEFLLYEEQGVENEGPPYLISSDHKRIHGKEVYEALSKGKGVKRDTTITLVFDTCHIATFFDKVIEFPYLYRASAIGGSTPHPQGNVNSGQMQIIFVAATQFDEVAGTFKQRKDSDEANGAVTTIMTDFFEDARASRSVQALVDRLYKNCQPRQTPQIQALRPIEDDFKLVL